jgi:hypothetical protein
VNYSRGNRIDIAMDSSKVQTVNVVGQAQGVYLEPLPPRADTTRAAGDSTGAAAADTTGGRGLPTDSTRRVPADSTRRAPADTTRPRPRRP